MCTRVMTARSDNSKRNIVFFGETGTGKSSAINLLLETTTAAGLSNDSQPCTPTTTRYETTLNGTKYNLWDTRGLGEGRSFFQTLFGGSSEKELKKFLKERHRSCEIDLLVYCIRGSRATDASVKYYNNFCAITRRLAAPVVIMVTQLEQENDMEEWWSRNSFRLKELKMEFDDHVCITTLPQHPRLAESRQKLVDLITRHREWEAKESGSYFGSPVQKSTLSAPPRKRWIWSIFKAIGGTTIGEIGRSPRSSNYTVSCAPSSSTTDSSYHTANSLANSPASSMPPSPIVQPPTPCTVIPPVELLRINTNTLRASDRPQPPSEETSSMRSSLRSMSYPSSHSSRTSYSEVYLESCMEEIEDYLSELPFKHSAATVRRRINYATRSGAFGDIWECDLISGGSSRLVAVKALKTNTNTNGHEGLRSHEKKLRRELKIWGRLRHRNVVPLLGVVSGFGPLPSTVSPWFCNGSLSCYLGGHQVSKSDKHRLLGDIAVGLCYLHSQDVIHGDLHSDNVLVDDQGTACLADFGLSFINDFVGTSYLKSNMCGGVNFADPALVERAYSSQDNVCYPTRPCDIYSFGGLMLHVLSGKKPYDGVPSPSIILKVLKGERPQIPPRDKHTFTHWHKSLIRGCWDHEEHKRPQAEDLVRKFDRSTSGSALS